MKLVDLKVTEFINAVDSKAVTPGGGSVSALASSIGVALVRMVGHVTVNKKKFRALDQGIQDKYNNVVNSLLSVKEELIELVDKDTDAFNLIMSAFRLPKETSDDKAVRKQAILDGTIEAIKVPYRIAEISLVALKDIDFILEYGNVNAASDVGVGALMLCSGVEGSLLNVEINLPGLVDEEMINFYNTNSARILEEAILLKNSVVKKVKNKL
ncbi:MAG: Methenyltetrahydrofolate cyclohydrolase [Candidatus Izimaplasma bacterium HR2]|nr:MAG: Methenyltetrahydrofolate cyclohydrolase [Candidatus Izimaplasma bacterium HR2]